MHPGIRSDGAGILEHPGEHRRWPGESLPASRSGGRLLFHWHSSHSVCVSSSVSLRVSLTRIPVCVSLCVTACVSYLYPVSIRSRTKLSKLAVLLYLWLCLKWQREKRHFRRHEARRRPPTRRRATRARTGTGVHCTIIRALEPRRRRGRRATATPTDEHLWQVLSLLVLTATI